MKKKDGKNVDVVQETIEPKKPEKLGFEAYSTVRRHSRVLYLPLEPIVCRMHDIQKGDIVRVRLLTLKREPRPDEPLREPSRGDSKAKGEWAEE